MNSLNYLASGIICCAWLRRARRLLITLRILHMIVESTEMTPKAEKKQEKNTNKSKRASSCACVRVCMCQMEATGTKAQDTNEIFFKSNFNSIITRCET